MLLCSKTNSYNKRRKHISCTTKVKNVCSTLLPRSDVNITEDNRNKTFKRSLSFLDDTKRLNVPFGFFFHSSCRESVSCCIFQR